MREADELAVPCDPETERALLSTICAPGADQALEEIMPTLDEEDFLVPAHRAIFRAIRHLLVDGQEVNSLTLKDALDQAGNLPRVGGYPGLVEILGAEEVGRPQVLVRVLREKRLRRGAMAASGEILRKASDVTVPLEEIRDLLRNRLEDLEGQGGPRPAAQRLQMIRWNEMKDLPIPEVEWCWNPFFPKVPLSFLVSHPGHGKSILATQFAVAKAVGLPLFGFPTGAPGGTGLLALEDDRSVVHRRIRAVVAGYGPLWTPEQDRLLDVNFRLMVRARQPLLNLNHEDQALHLSGLSLELAASMRSTEAPATWLGIDTLNAVNGGDENDATAARPLIATAYSISDSLGCSVCGLHHFRKTGVGRNAPTLMDRMDPELMRGSSALLGGARAVCQLGWILPQEAGKVNLEQKGCQRLYSILGLTKINDGPMSPWLLLEHSQNAGLWVPVPNGEQLLAQLRGGNAVEDLNKAETLLLDLYSGMDSKALALKHYPDDPKADTKLKNAIADLRRRPSPGHGWVQTGSRELTALGFEKVQELKGRQAANSANPQEEGDESWRDSA
jgi:hypothetical protein